MSVVQTQSSSNPKNESVDASAPLLPSSSSSALSPSRDIFPTSHQPETIENPTTTTTAVNKSSQPLKMSLAIAVAPHPSPPVVVATNIPQWQQALDSPDKLLSTIGPRNGFVLFIWIAMALVWGIGALPTMVSAFLMDDICRKNNGTGDGQEAGRNCTPQKGTVTEEFHLDEAHVFLVDLTTSAYIAGMSLGNICLPFVADRNGRRPALLASMFFSGVVGLASALSPNIFAFITMRFVQGIFFSGCILINWNLAYECIPLSLRSQTAVVFGLFWVLGYCLVAPMALLLSGWRPLIAAASAPSILFAIFYFFTIPESFHFLASKRKVAAIRGWIRRANKSAERSGTRKIEPNELNAFLEKLEEKRSSVVESVESMASKRSQKQWKESFGTLLLYLLVSVFLWTVDSFTYYGLSLFSTQLAGNRYVNFMLVALVEVPSYVFAPFFLDRMGRRLTTAFMHLLAAAAFFLAAAISNHPQLYLLLWLLAKYSISTSFTGLFVYGSEYFPTAKRNICMGICATVSQAFSIFTPTVIRLVANLSPVAPMLFYGIASLLACALTFLLPETRGKELPERTE